MTKPVIKVNSAPKISSEEFKAKGGSTSKYIRDPGTYALKVTAAEWGQSSKADNAWMSVKFVTQEPSGQEYTFFVEIPIECKNDFLYGEKLLPYRFNDFVKFMACFGVKIEYETAMQQVGAIFGDLEQFVGKNLRLRIGHKGNHIKYFGKTEDNKNIYKFVNKDGEEIDGVVLNDFDACAAHATENKIKYSRYMDILEFIPSSENQFSESASADDVEIPF